MIRTTDDLVSDVFLKLVNPENQTLISPSQCCVYMRDVQDGWITPRVVAAVEAYFQTIFLTQPDSAKKIAIPDRAIGSKVVLLWSAQDSSETSTGTNVWEPQTSRQALASAGYWNANYDSWGSRTYTIRANSVCLPPAYNGNDWFRLEYYRRPSAPVPTEQCRQVISVAGQVVTTTLAPVTSSWTQTEVLDIHTNANPAAPILDNGSAVAVTDSTVEFDPSADLSGISAGDWLCQAGTCAIPQIPADLWPAFVDWTVLSLLESTASAEELKAKLTSFGTMLDGLITLITPRNIETAKTTGTGQHFKSGRS